ncbi:MAG: HDOD domain-containing protein [Proteobacteria bacterium]|jgi:EAL and modified HD-GYP domain-containing signal transduction protein|nr:HDOD domain-containing protein [Desulfocapsa sp.]MBU3943891.1 HDOD domain-containing protein [Pseudomonadota bacterium]MCG2742950.1 HDOD domain-containing protein [Desulfobacteraceae bacterium]MBU4027900.1 HDOD domain-containing protein [Pseudomonadota bacterium]MBU4042386.1 HDOD domain-containing protein [Pseudomonadota bacterium]
MDVFVARQPIFNQHKKIFAYELLFRTGMSNAFPGVDGDEATSSLLSSSFFTVGIEQIASGHKAFVNFTEDMLVRGVPTMFSKDSVVVEVLEDVQPSEEVIGACRELVAKGYTLALDDFVYADNLIPLIEIAKIIKVDFRLTPIEQIKEMVETLKKYSCKLLAEKIETYAEFTLARDMGFVYFQGYFFSKPEVLKNKDIASSQLSLMQLIVEVNRAEFEVKDIEKLVNQDISISFKLLKYLNSAYYSRLQPISSIRQAIAYLGERGTRLFVSLIATSKLSEHKPDELIRTSCIRARFLERIGQNCKLDKGDLFMLGLFSLLDAMLDASMEVLMTQLPISEEITQALVHKSGSLFPYLQLIQLYEAGEWVKLDRLMGTLNLDEHKIMDSYLDAVHWADNFI